MAPLIDLDIPEPQIILKPQLSRDTLASMTLLCEETMKNINLGSDIHLMSRVQPLNNQHSHNPSAYSLKHPIQAIQGLNQNVTVEFASALSIRSSDIVIADLKNGRHQRQKIHSGTTVAQDISGEQVEGIIPVSELCCHEGVTDGAEDVESGLEDELFALRKPRKISERKRIQTAVQDSWFQSYQKQQAKAAADVGAADTESLSVKYLVRQTESQRIISSPREYQVELFERAKEKNIIAVLDTGSGKTLIAVLLLQHVIKQELEDRASGKPKRVAFFLVDSVQLIFQQFAVLECNLDQPMDRYCGAMGCDLLDKQVWEKALSKNVVIVCTAEVLRNSLHHSFIKMEGINLLIFDEAHHAKKDHPYARIIKDFYTQVLDKSQRPKIFGMTASPVDTRLNVKQAAAELEAILHCQIVTASDQSLLQYADNEKLEKIDEYDPLEAPFETSLCERMKEWLEDNEVFRKLFRYAKEACSELGTWCADHLWLISFSEEEIRKLEARTERKFIARKGTRPVEEFDRQILHLQDASKFIETYNFNIPQPSLDHLSTKVMNLMRYLKERFERPTDDKCIVFVKQRYTAKILADLFSYHNIGTPNLRVGALVGGSASDVADTKVSFKQQVITLMKFRNGLLNCLFATSVAEEGLDIPDCNLVIRFDLYSTVIQYIQSRGRARQVNSRYIHMIEKGNREHIAILKEVRRNEGALRKFCQALPADRLLTGNDFDMDYFLNKEKKHRVYTEPSTGAKLTYKKSLTILANFVSSLPQSCETSLTPEYFVISQSRQFVCEVILPDTSPVRGAIGLFASTKQVAKCSAAFEACLLLRKGKYLDANLLSTYVKQLPAMRNAHLAINSKKQEAYEMRTKPELWSVSSIPNTVYLTIFTLADPHCLLRQWQPLGLLTRTPLPQFPDIPLFFGEGRHSSVKSRPFHNAINLGTAKLDLINGFTLRIFDDVFSKKYIPDLNRTPYFIVPIQVSTLVTDSPSDLIAWDILHQVQENSELKWNDNTPDVFFENRYVVDLYDGSRKLWTKGVTHDYAPLDPVPSNTAPRTGARKSSKNIMEYSCSLWAKTRSSRVFREIQPVVEAEYIPLRRNLLDDSEFIESEVPRKCFIILEPLKISALPTTVVVMAYLFPSIIHRIESYLIALEACSMLHLEISPELALEAMTKDSDNSEEHGEEQIKFQYGMGRNYERLEFLGDCFLKMATSISLYSQHPTDDEFEYHVKRMQMICNQNLFNIAKTLKLYEYIRSQSFNRRAWYPEGLVLEKGKTAAAPKSHRLADKTIADVCEALIGAALLTFHTTNNLDNAVRAVTELVCSTDHPMKSYKEYYQAYEKPKYQTAPASASQRNLSMQVQQKHAYTFKYPRLLRSAFTHPSYPFIYEHVPNFQRLEFLGDSLLDMVCVNFLYHRFPQRDPQWLTEHKMAMVSNQFLGALCVSLGFHRHLLQFNGQLQKQIQNYVTEITDAFEEAGREAVKAGKNPSERSPDYWVHAKQPPKCLPDMIEAYVGAIFVDSEYDYTEVERFFEKQVQPYFENIELYDTYANKHPVTFLTNFLEHHMGCSDWSISSRQLPDIGDGLPPQIVATVMLHNQIIMSQQGTSGRYAKISVAKKALEMLKGLPLPEYRANYQCDCSSKDNTDNENDDGDREVEQDEFQEGQPRNESQNKCTASPKEVSGLLD